MRTPNGQSAMGNNSGIPHYADEIQRRIDAIGLGGAPYPHDPYMAGHPYTAQHAPAHMQSSHPGFANAPHANIHPPMYADVPAPVYQQADMNAEVESLRSAMGQISSQLHSMGSQAQNSGVEQTNSQVLAIAGELDQLKSTLSQVVAAQPEKGEIDRVRDAIKDLGQQILKNNKNEKPSIDSESYAKVVEASHERLTRQIADLDVRMSDKPADTEIYTRTLEASHDDLKAQIIELQRTMGSTNDNRSAEEEQIRQSQEHMLSKLDAVQEAVSGLHDKEEADPEQYFDKVETRLEEITRAVVALSQGGNDNTDQFDRLEARISAVSKTLETFNDDKHLEDLKPEMGSIAAQLSDLTEQVSSLSSTVSNNKQIDQDSLSDLKERFDNFAAIMPLGTVTDKQSGESLDKVALLARLDSLVDQSRQASNNSNSSIGEITELADRISSLENQIAVAISQGAEGANEAQSEEVIKRLDDLKTHLEASGSGAAIYTDQVGSEDIAGKLTSIEEQLASSRDVSIEVASQVAEDAVGRLIAQMPNQQEAAGIDPETLSGLIDGIRELQTTTNMSNEQNAQTLQSLSVSLGALVERLDSIEANGVHTPNTASLSEEAHATDYATGMTDEVETAYEHASEQSGEFTQTHEPNYQQEPEQTYVQEQEADHQTYDLSEAVGEEPEYSDIHQAEPVYETQHDAEYNHVEETALSASPYDQGVAQEEKSTGQDMVAEYRALVGQKDEQEDTAKPIAHDLVAAAEQAEQVRQQAKASAVAESEPLIDSIKDREFVSADMAIETNEVPVYNPELPSHDAPSLDMDTFPSIDPTMEETPIEPGTGGPDLAALVRQANDRRKTLAQQGEASSGTDFIAAARRAAQAAAEEASAAHEEVVQKEKEEAGGGLMSSLPGFLTKRKKTVAIAAAAALLAALAIPLIKPLMLSENSVQIASVTQPAITEVQDNALETTLPEKSESARIVTPVSENETAEISDESLDVTPPADNQIAQVDTTPEPQQVSQSKPSVQFASLAQELNFGNSSLKQAVSAGEPGAFNEVARRYTNGLGVEKNLETAAKWYSAAAEMGHAPSQYLIGNFSEKGLGTQRDLKAAANWYEKAADNGNIVAMHNLAVLHATPNAISEKPDMAKAYNWFAKAAEYGVRDSQVNLGIFHTKGIGTSIDLPEAYKWFTIAAVAGDKDADTKRKVISDALRPDQLADAKSRVENWKPAETIELANRVTPKSEWIDQASSAPVALNKQTVAKTQALLGKLGYNAGPADGVIGKKTRQAIAEFQQRVGLSITGQISTELLRELEAVAI
jgi:localization factor PodJL